MYKSDPGPEGGRPRLIPEEEDCQTVEELAEKGLRLEDIAGALGVSKRWLSQRVNDVESELLIPYRRGRAKRAARLLEKYAELEDAGDLAVRERALRKELAWLGYSETQQIEADVRQETELRAGVGEEINLTFNVVPAGEEGRRLLEEQEEAEEDADFELIEGDEDAEA